MWRKRAFVIDDKSGLLGLSKDDAGEVHSRLWASYDGLARSTYDGVANAASFCEDSELREDILV